MEPNEIKIMKTAILNEVEGEKYYRSAALQAEDPDLTQAFVHLAEDERQHQMMLRDYLSGLMKGIDIMIDLSNLQGAPSPHVFGGFNSAQVKKGLEISAFHVAVLMEKASMDFYRQAASQTALPGARKLYEFLIGWEMQHLEAMEKIYDMLTEDWWDKQSFSPA